MKISDPSIFHKRNKELIAKGVIIKDPQNTYIEKDVEIQPSVIIHPHNHITGNSKISQGCEIEPYCIIRSCVIGQQTLIKSGSYLEDSTVGHHTSIGPYARLRLQTQIGDHCKIGNFVEIKKSTIANHVKAAHLTYLGDAQIGSNVNIGCGVITCNYREDGKKYQTYIEDHVFIGSDVQLIAPIKIGQKSIVGSGSTITENIPSKSLAIARARQVIKPLKKKL